MGVGDGGCNQLTPTGTALVLDRCSMSHRAPPHQVGPGGETITSCSLRIPTDLLGGGNAAALGEQGDDLLGGGVAVHQILFQLSKLRQAAGVHAGSEARGQLHMRPQFGQLLPGWQVRVRERD